jgi:hypothetical protein
MAGLPRTEGLFLIEVDNMYGHRIRRLAMLAFAVAGAGAAQAQTGALTVDLDAAGSFASRYEWTLDKQVMPSSADRFIGETQQLAYTLVLTKGEAVESDFEVTGSITIANPTDSAATVESVTVDYGAQSVTNDCATGALAAGASITCELSFATISSDPQPLQVVVATSGAVGGAEASVDVAFESGPVQNDSVTVTDTLLPEPLTFSASGTHSYTGSATCVDGNTVKIDNDATIVETGVTDSARARVACHVLRMERSVRSQGGTRWSWDVEKTHALTGPLQLAGGATQDVTYTITATATSEEGENLVVGAISAINTHPGFDATLVSVSAAINGLAAEVDCPSLVVPHATYDVNRNIVLGRLTCPFTVTLPDGMTATSVTGHLLQQLFTYGPDGSATPAGTRDITGTAPIAGPLGAGNTDECIELADVYLGAGNDLGDFCASVGSTTVTRTFTGPIVVAQDSECEFSVPNLARLTTNDTGTVDEATTTVAVERTDCEVEQPTGLLEVDINASGAFTRRYPWTIEKTVTPESSDRFIGETQQLAYTLTLTRGEAEDAGFVVTGTANIVNNTEGAADITAIVVEYGGNPVPHTCALGELAAGATRTCELEFTVANDDPQTLTIDVDTGGSILGDDASTMVAFGEPVVTGETVTVEDTLLPGTLTFDDSGTHQYTHDATCVDGNTVVVENTATIVETGDSDSARARVACHATRMERSVATFGGIDWDWDIQKTHGETLPLQVVAGQSYDVSYTITATATASDSSGEVHGAITVINTHPSVDAVILSVAARINSTDATVTCPTPMIAPHATYDAASNIVVGKLVCPFTVTLPEGETPTSVTGRVEQQLFDYDADGNATPDGTRVLQGTQPVSGLPAGGSNDECVDLVDVYLGETHDLGEFCASEGETTTTRTFTGSIAVTADDECEFSVPNLARLTTNDTGAVDEASTSVSVERTDCDVEQPSGLLEVDLTASGAFTRRFPWTIEKTVTPASSDRFIGETQELAYTLTVTRGEAEDAGFMVTGTATIANNTEGAADITAITVEYGGNPVTHTCALGELAAGASRTCDLEFSVASDDPQTLSIAVETSGSILGDDASTMVAFGEPVVTDASIHVDDTLLPEDIEFDDSGTFQYTHDATCVDGNTVVVDNTATIVETGDSDSAHARVACHAIRMERSVTGSSDLDYTWNVEKTHGIASPLQVEAGGNYDVVYSITATATADAENGGGGIEGAITVLNTNPVTDAVILSVGAMINTTPATVTCPMPMIAPRASYDAGHNVVVGKLVCPFTVTLPAGETATSVTGRVEQQLFDYDSEGDPTPDGTKVLQGTQPVGALPGGTITDECVALTDEYLGEVHSLGDFCVGEGELSVTRSFTGTIAVTQEDECEFSVANTARLVTNDTGATDESTTAVPVERTDCDVEEPEVACTRTQGYWKTHSINGPAPYDNTWAQVGETTHFFLASSGGTALSWYGVMWMAPKGNAYYILAPQFAAATLNTLAGASAPVEVLTAMDQAQALFAKYTPGEIGALSGDDDVRQEFLALATVLADYNEGSIGPGHCETDKHLRIFSK